MDMIQQFHIGIGIGISMIHSDLIGIGIGIDNRGFYNQNICMKNIKSRSKKMYLTPNEVGLKTAMCTTRPLSEWQIQN